MVAVVVVDVVMVAVVVVVVVVVVVERGLSEASAHVNKVLRSNWQGQFN